MQRAVSLLENSPVSYFSELRIPEARQNSVQFSFLFGGKKRGRILCQELDIWTLSWAAGLAEGALTPTVHVASKDVKQCLSQH